MDQPQVNDQIKSAIKAKLKELGTYVDDELPDYILVMVANKKSMTQMEVDLEIFLHNRAKEFTKWLFAVLEKLNRVSKVKKSKGSKEGKDKKEPKKKSKKAVESTEVTLTDNKGGLDDTKPKIEAKKREKVRKESKETPEVLPPLEPKDQLPEKVTIEDNFEIEIKLTEEQPKVDPINDETLKTNIEEKPKISSRSTSRRLSKSRERSSRRSRSFSSSRSGSRERVGRRKRSESSSSESSRSRSSSRYKRQDRRRRSPLRPVRRSRSPLPFRTGYRGIRGRNSFPRRRSRSPYLPQRNRDVRQSRTSNARRPPPRRSPPRRNRHRSISPERSTDQPKQSIQVPSVVSVVKQSGDDSQYNALGLLKQSIQDSNKKTTEKPPLKSKKKAVPNPVKIASLVLQAAQEADKSIKKMSQKEKEREAIIEKIQARAKADEHRKTGLTSSSSRVSDIRQRIGPRISTSTEVEKREPRENFVIEIRNSHLEESDLRQRLSNRSSKPTTVNSTIQETNVSLRRDQNLRDEEDDDFEALEEMRRRALASMSRRKEAAAAANSSNRKSVEEKEPLADSSSSSDDSSSDSSDTSSSDESSDSELPKAKVETKRPFETTFVVTLDGIDESYFEKRKQSGQSTNQLNLLKAKYNDNPMQMGRGIDEPIIVRHSKGISVPVLEAVGGGGGVQDPKSLEMMYKLSNQSKRSTVEKITTPIITSENIKKEKSDVVVAAKRAKEPATSSVRPVPQIPNNASPIKRPAEVKTIGIEKKKRPRIEAPVSSPKLSLLKPFKPTLFHHERKERALSPVAPTQSICRYWPNCTRGFQCLYYHPKTVRPIPKPTVPSDRYRWRAEQTRV